MDDETNSNQPNNLPALELTENHKLLILKRWQNDPAPSIQELMDLCWPEMKGTKGFDGRSNHGKLIKSFLLERDLKAKTKTFYEKKGLLELSEPNKEYIRNNLNMGNKEIAQIIFNKSFLAPTSQEARTVAAYREELKATGMIFMPSVDKNESENNDLYTPPNTIVRTCARIEKYVQDSGYNFDKLTSTQKKHVNSLMSYLHSYTFNHQINNFSSSGDRDLFESVFISYCYDKPDLTKEEVDKMIMIATEKIIASGKLRMIEQLTAEQQRQLVEDNKIAINIIESINVQTKEYNDSIKRQQSLYNDLTEKRSERIKGKLKETASVLNLVELWKQEDTRQKMINIANQKKEKLKEEIERLENMDDLVCMIAGIDKNEVLNN